MDEVTAKRMEALTALIKERLEMVEEERMERTLTHAHWCLGDPEESAHGWEHSESVCWGEEPTLRATALTCPECHSRVGEEWEEPTPRGLGCPR
jgi:hypothetical protein